MRVNRRTAIKQLALLSSGALLLPSCMEDHSKAPVGLHNYQIDRQQEQLLETLTATIIPSGSTPGASAVSAHLFTLKMLDDCYSKEDRDKYLKGMQQFDAAARAGSGHSFVSSSAAQRESLLASIDGKKGTDKDLNFFYSTTKRMTILAYSSSQYYLTRVQVYELVPGRWHGCTPVKPRLKTAS
jgi:Gluconate 2-dehydrogenase subunit 3